MPDDVAIVAATSAFVAATMGFEGRVPLATGSRLSMPGSSRVSASAALFMALYAQWYWVA